jgi:hypothetical protein
MLAEVLGMNGVRVVHQKTSLEFCAIAIKMVSHSIVGSGL